MDTNERLAKLEAKMEIFLGLLQEIRDDLKEQPSKAELDNAKSSIEELKASNLEIYREIDELKKNYWKMAGKLTGIAAVVGIVSSLATKLL